MPPTNAGHAASPAASPPPGFAPIEVVVKPVEFDRLAPTTERFGSLAWRGGFELISQAGEFGGFSDIAVDKSGKRLLAISDQGAWLNAELTYAQGRLTGLKHATMATMKGSRGQAYRSKRWSDAEAMATGPRGLGGTVWVAFERRHRIEAYRFGKAGGKAAANRRVLPAPLANAPDNKGIEAMTRLGANTVSPGSLLVVTEGVRDAKGDSVAWLLGGKSPGRLTIARDGDYNVTEIATLPNGDLVLLERYLGSLIDFSIRLRRIKARDVVPSARLEGRILFEGGLRYTIDNMEGLSVHKSPDGEVRLTLISDDNFSRFQRTLILQFALVEG
ncbi:MAG: esterase-like activity of phytase family protein [Alphaproteobacteria bacterium]